MPSTVSHPDAPAPHIRPLTALRFFAAAWVVLYHYWPALDATTTPGLVAKGYLGVELFFVLSGFVISHVYLREVERGGFRYGPFLRARLARVYPLHLLTLAAVAALGVAALAVGGTVGADVLDVASLPANLLLVHAWGLSPSAAFNHPSWSISAEWFAYLAFPAFAAVSLRYRDRPGVAVGLALLLLFALYAGFEALAGFPLTQATIGWGALRIVPCFALGCAVHLAWRAHARPQRALSLAGAGVSALAVVLLAEMQAPDAIIVAGFGGLVFSLAAVWSTRPAEGRSGTFVHLGEISYSTYMICVPWKLLAVNLAARTGLIADERMPAGLWLLMLGMLIPLSMGSYHLVEKPARAWLRAHRPGMRAADRQGATFQPVT